MASDRPPFAACTILASNYLARALVLHDSLKAQHPEVDFWLLLIDDAPLGPLAQLAVDRRGIHLLRPDEIALPSGEVANFRMAYDLTEVSTAYKPWTMEMVVKRTGLHVFYIDPDIEFFAPMTGLIEAVEAHELVLTPHVLHPMQREGFQPAESDILGSGIYNLGFLGMNRNAGRIIAWWQERLMRECYSAPADQRFTDQRWIDFAPGLFDCFISKDETCNVAYWNADARPIVLEGGEYVVRGKALTFFHYSGLDERTPHLLTRHHKGRPRVLLSEQPTLEVLAENYIRSVHAVQEECPDVSQEYPFNVLPGGGGISLDLRRIFLRELMRSEKEKQAPPPSPFGPQGVDPFYAWLREPILPNGAGVPMPRMVLLFRELRQDLVTTFPDPTGRDAVRLLEWFRKDGAKQFLLPPHLVPQPVVIEKTRPVKLVPGLEIIGYLRTESGVGQAARLLAQGLQNSTVPFTTRVDSTPKSRQLDPFKENNADASFEGEVRECCVLCVNADSVASVRRRLGRDYLRKRPVAGLWFWELDTFPKHLHAAFLEVDEVWVASEFVRQAVAAVSPVPVHLIPLPFGIAEPAPALDRRAVGVPDGFFFLFSFDFHSVFQRKNPLGTIAAFTRAFREGEGPVLVIKGINGDAHLTLLEQLRHAARDRRDIIILSHYLDYPTNQALTAACGCYISLHRSEGLGLTMAEAMRQQRPVIATAYSGNMDFMNEGNSYLCRFTMTAVGADAAPYSPTLRWAEPDIEHAAELMRHVFSHPEEAADRGRRAAVELAKLYNSARCAAAVETRWQSLISQKAVSQKEFVISDQNSPTQPALIKILRKASQRPRDISAAVPSLGSLLFQGPRKLLRKMLQSMELQRKPFDDAVVTVTSDHDKRIAMLEKSLEELREQNAALLRAQAVSSQAH